MGLKSWFGTADQEEAKPEQRRNTRLSIHAEVLVSGGAEPLEDRIERVDLVDFASGGLRLRTDSPVEVGQTVWVRTTVTHVSEHGRWTELGVNWDAGRACKSNCVSGVLLKSERIEEDLDEANEDGAR